MSGLVRVRGRRGLNRFARGALTAVGGAVAAEALRRLIFSGDGRRHEPWERAPYQDFPNRVLILGGGFAGYTVAKSLCRMTRGRDDVGVMVISREIFSPSGPCSPDASAAT